MELQVIVYPGNFQIFICCILSKQNFVIFNFFNTLLIHKSIIENDCSWCEVDDENGASWYLFVLAS